MAANWHKVAKVDDIDDEEPLQVRVGETLIALCKLEDQVYAISDICSHEFALLSDGIIEGDCVECPLHMAQFHIPTGEARSAPAEDPIATYPVKLEEGEVWVEVEEK